MPGLFVGWVACWLVGWFVVCLLFDVLMRCCVVGLRLCCVLCIVVIGVLLGCCVVALLFGFLLLLCWCVVSLSCCWFAGEVVALGGVIVLACVVALLCC